LLFAGGDLYISVSLQTDAGPSHLNHPRLPPTTAAVMVEAMAMAITTTEAAIMAITTTITTTIMVVIAVATMVATPLLLRVAGERSVLLGHLVMILLSTTSRLRMSDCEWLADFAHNRTCADAHECSIYTWSENCPSRARELGYECIPMLWGGDNARIQRFKDKVKPGYARFVAGFNECVKVASKVFLTANIACKGQILENRRIFLLRGLPRSGLRTSSHSVIKAIRPFRLPPLQHLPV
jgi:hypothetical protein